jgi:hypothetical protein
MLLLPFKCLRACTRPTGSGAFTRLPRGGHLSVFRCGLMALAALPRGTGTFRARCYQGSLALAVGFGCRSR